MKTKQTLKKYIAPLIVGTALTFGNLVYAKNTGLPINPETRQKLAEAEESREKLKEVGKETRLNDFKRAYIEKSEQARRYFNKSILDGNFELNEQKQLYLIFKEAKDYRLKLNEIAINSGKGYLMGAGHEGVVYNYKNMDDEDERLFKLLKENIKGIDFGKPSLEKVLENEGLEISVERKRTIMDVCSILGLIFGGLLFASRAEKASRPYSKPLPPSNRFCRI